MLHQFLPLPALIGRDIAIQALLLLAVEPRLAGVVLAAPAGTGKSTLARGLHALVGEQAPFVEVPPAADAESLLGGLDLEATLREGQRVARKGLLARAHTGVLCVDGLNLLDDASANLVLGALDSGIVQVEREGLSLRAPARFSLVGAYDPSEGLPRRHLLDRIGLLVVLPAAVEATQRAEVVRHNRTMDDGRWTMDDGLNRNNRDRRGKVVGHRPSSLVYAQAWQEDLALMRGQVLAGREQLPAVQIAPEQIRALASAALAYGVEGQRADLFASYAACAAAALDGRDEVAASDLELAVRLVILPRATRAPQPAEQAPPTPQPQPSSDQPQTADDQSQTADDQSQTTPPRDQPPSQAEQPPLADTAVPDEQILAALAAELPPDLLALPFRALRRGRSGSRGTTEGKRGRHVRSAPGDVRRARIDLPATLRAAAPWQPLRTQDHRPQTTDHSADVGNDSEQSAVSSRRSAVALRAEDLRVKQFKSKAGALYCFAVDASGSMALHRMRQAKGAVQSLLQQAYVHRDRVALLAFRGQAAQLLLPPSQSVELARRALDQLPTGGGTPLAAALVAALEVAQQAKARGILQTVLVLLTDGRANVGLRVEREGIERELQVLGRQVAAAGITALVIDTQRSYLSRGEARRLAEWLGGTYIYLPNASGAQIAAAAGAAAGA